MTLDLNKERDAFEEAALALFIQRREAGMRMRGDDPEVPATRESVFWRDERGEYGVKAFNAAWWAWKTRAERAHSDKKPLPNEVNALLREASIFINKTMLGEKPDGRWPLCDELDGLAGMIDNNKELERQLEESYEEKKKCYFAIEQQQKAIQNTLEKINRLKELLRRSYGLLPTGDAVVESLKYEIIQEVT